MKNIFAVLLIIASIGIVYVLFIPTYSGIQTARGEKAQYEKALNDSRAVEERQSVLSSKFNDMAPSDIDRLEKMIPDSIDNIRLIIEIDRIAQRYNMTVKNPSISQKTENMSSLQSALAATAGLNSLYGVGVLSFGVTGTYEAYIAFIKDIEKSLRLMDITNISLVGASANSSSSTYNFETTINTYWLK